MLSENSRNEWTRRIECGVSLEYAPRCVREDKELALYAVSKHGSDLEFVSDDLKKDIDVVAASVQQDVKSLKYTDEQLQLLIVLSGINCLRDENTFSEDFEEEKGKGKTK